MVLWSLVVLPPIGSALHACPRDRLALLEELQQHHHKLSEDLQGLQEEHVGLKHQLAQQAAATRTAEQQRGTEARAAEGRLQAVQWELEALQQVCGGGGALGGGG